MYKEQAKNENYRSAGAKEKVTSTYCGLTLWMESTWKPSHPLLHPLNGILKKKKKKMKEKKRG